MAKLSLVIKAKKRKKFKVREYHRCELCGRPRGYIKKFKMCRICFRLNAARGLIPGVIKASW